MDIKLHSLGGDDDDQGTLTRQEFAEHREGWPLGTRPRCHYCGRLLGIHRFGNGRFCTIRCRRLWHRTRPAPVEKITTKEAL